jgi:hypothetical protein
MLGNFPTLFPAMVTPFFGIRQLYDAAVIANPAFPELRLGRSSFITRPPLGRRPALPSSKKRPKKHTKTAKEKLQYERFPCGHPP